MAPNRWTTEPSAEWLAAHAHRFLVRRAEEDGGNFAHRAGSKIKEWIESRDPIGLFVATCIISFVVFISICALMWETLRKIRKRASGKGWKQLQNDREQRTGSPNGGRGMPLGRFYEPRQGQLYDPPRAGAGGPVMMRQGGNVPPLPPMPRQYQQGFQQQQQQQQKRVPPPRVQSSPAAVGPSRQVPQQIGTASAPSIDYQGVVYQSTPTPTRENSQISQSTTLGADSAPSSNRNSFASNDTEPLILPAAPLAPTSAPIPIPSPPTAAPTPVREKSFTSSFTSDKAPTIELKRTWTLKSWLPGDKKEDPEQEKKGEEKGESIL